MKRYIILSLLLSMGIMKGFTQGKINNLYGLSWEISVPTNNEFLDKTSLAGGRAEYRHFLSAAPVSFGVAVSWNSYEQYMPTQTVYYKDNNAAITTDMDKVVYTVPIMATAHYYFNYGKKVMPYVGLGIGTQYSEQTIYYNIFVEDEFNWGFAIRPEIGALIRPRGNNWGILLGANYGYATNKNDLFQIDNLKNFSFNIGFFLSH
ncbi:outer membrane beta-barrel protein [Chitinophaga sp. MM2321]|uniref:outer membrane beta-barrel protein n=1 Tax=Chitinophaga sp. MM2321 TaxID=3137178 RepID=UPI0032D5AF0F